MTALTVAEAIDILGIPGSNNLTEQELRKHARAAQKKWHPDSIAHKGLSEEEVGEYNRKFHLITEAVELLRRELFGIGKASEDIRDPEDVLREYAPSWKDALSKSWEDIKQCEKKMEEEIRILFEGFTVREALDIEKKAGADHELMFIINANVYWAFVFILADVFFPLSQHPILEIIFIVFTLFLWACFCIGVLFSVPLARWIFPFSLQEKWTMLVYGLFYKIGHPIAGEFGEARLNIETGKYERSTNFLALLTLPALFVTYVIVKPLRFIIGGIFKLTLGDKRLKVVKTKARYFAGVHEDYIGELMSKNVKDYDFDDLKVLSHLHSEFLAPAQ